MGMSELLGATCQTLAPPIILPPRQLPSQRNAKPTVRHQSLSTSFRCALKVITSPCHDVPSAPPSPG